MVTPRTRGAESRRAGRGHRRQVLPLELALWVIVAFAVIVGVVQLAASAAHPDMANALVAFTVVLWIWVVAGVLAWWRRPANGTGPLILLGAVALCLGGLGNLQLPLSDVVSALFATSVFAVTVHLLHAFPSGRLRGRLSVGVVIAGYAAATGLDALRVVAPRAGALISVVQPVLGALVMTATAAILTIRLVISDRRHRRILLPLSAYGIVAVLGIVAAPRLLTGTAASMVGVVQLALMAGLPVAFLLGVVAGSFARTTALESLSAWLAVGGPDKPAVERALRASLGDDSLQVVYWSAQSGSFVDADGVAFLPAAPAGGRTHVPVRVDGRLVGAIDYDTRVTDDPLTVRRAGEILAIAIDRERLTAELTLSNEELIQSRRRLMEAAYAERARIARDLHDGLQVQLVLLALEAQSMAGVVAGDTPAAAEHLRAGIDEAAAELRRLVHNVMPAPLRERGLVAAVEELVDRAEVPALLSADVDESRVSSAAAHTAYFVIAELLTNAVKHAGATALRVSVALREDRLTVIVEDDGVGDARIGVGAGLRGLHDRVAALEGAVEIVSPRGGGTRVGVELPCV